MENLFPNNLKELTNSKGDINSNLPFKICSELRCGCGNDEFQVFKAVYSQTIEEKERMKIMNDLIQKYAYTLNISGNNFASKIEGDKEIFGYVDDPFIIS